MQRASHLSCPPALRFASLIFPAVCTRDQLIDDLTVHLFRLLTDEVCTRCVSKATRLSGAEVPAYLISLIVFVLFAEAFVRILPFH